MLPNAFIGKADAPTEEELSKELGPSKEFWDRIVAELAADLQVNKQEWNTYSKKAGWSLRLKKKDRNIVYLGPSQGQFNVAFILGDKAVKAAHESKLPKAVLTNLAESKKYPEGTAVRMVVKAAKDVEIVKKIAAIKVAN